MGAHLRRSLRARSIGQRITALLNTLRDLEAHAARLSRRLARGLTRRRPIRAARDADSFAAMPMLAAVPGADTS